MFEEGKNKNKKETIRNLQKDRGVQQMLEQNAMLEVQIKQEARLEEEAFQNSNQKLVHQLEMEEEVKVGDKKDYEYY